MALKQMCYMTGNTLFLRRVRVFLRPQILQTGAVEGLSTMFTYYVELQHTSVHGFRYPQSRSRKMNAGNGGWDQCVHISCIEDGGHEAPQERKKRGTHTTCVSFRGSRRDQEEGGGAGPSS